MPKPAWRHQREAVQFVDKLWKSGRRGALIAVCMGGGKGRIAIDLANSYSLSPVLILCPKRVVEVWRNQFLQHSAMPYHVLALDERAGTVADKTRQAADAMRWAAAQRQRLAIAINYESAREEPFAHWAMANAWPLVICDEIHRIKAPRGFSSKFASRLTPRSRYRLGLTGTPMPHQPIDIWGQFRFLDPSILDPTYGSFKLRHAVMGGYRDREIVDWRDLEDLHRKFYSIAYRVTDEVLDLPPEMDETLSVDLSAEAQRIYDDLERHMIAGVEGGIVTASNAMVKLLRLQQVTGGTLPDDDGNERLVDQAKETLLGEFLEDLDPEEPVVVFARFTSDLRAIERATLTAERRYAELSGKRDQLGIWQRSSGPDAPTVLGVQIQAGGVGVDMTRARLGVYYSHGFSLADYVQSRARIRRPPQARPVTFYHLQARHTVDPRVLRAVLARQDLVESVLKEWRCHRQPQLAISR